MRWTAIRKFELINAVRRGTRAKTSVLMQHGISEDEWQEWLVAYEAGGVDKLKVTKRQRK